jgi:hypothetical protein
MVLVIGDAVAQFKPAEQQYLENRNILFNSGFEQGKKNWTNSAGTFTLDSTKEVIGNKAGCVSLTAQTLDLSQTITTGYNTNLSGLQGIASAFVRSDVAGLQLCSLVDGAEQECNTIASDSKYREISIPLVFGGTSAGIKFKSTAAVTGEICLDNAFVGARKITQEIAQAEIFGKVVFPFTTNCVWSVAKTASFINMPIDTDCNLPNTSGSIEYDGDKSLHFVLPAGSPVGNYKIRLQGTLVYDFNTNNYCTFRFSDGVDSTHTQALYAQSADLYASSHIFDLEITTSPSTDKKFYLQAKSSATVAGSCQALANFDDMNIVVEYFPPKSSIITDLSEVCNVKATNNSGETITQDTEDIPWSTVAAGDDPCGLWTNAGNTGANTADAYTARKDGYVVAHLTINQSASGTTNPVRLFKDGGEIASCGNTTSNFSRNGVTCLWKAEKDSVYTFRVTNQNITLGNSTAHNISISELVDYATIIGKFKDVVTSPNATEPIQCSLQVGGATQYSDCVSGNCNKYAEVGDCGITVSHAGVGSVALNWDTAKITDVSCGFIPRAFTAATNAYPSWGGYSSTGATIRCRKGSDNANVDCFYSVWCKGRKP